MYYPAGAPDVIPVLVEGVGKYYPAGAPDVIPVLVEG
jgi:hypothetical protein